MQISSRFTIASHILIVIALREEGERITSDLLAGSVGVNPVIIRKTLSQLKKSGLVRVARGTGGAVLSKDLEDITLLDVYRAVESLGKSGQLFSFHERPNPDCSIGRNVRQVLDKRLLAAQAAMEKELAQTNLASLVADAEYYIQKES
ncbi:Rrf2 family transcriptional regulator [Streptococcus oricebi]|uniref:Rrf2 family transcriptional regulator n=1 Tax=Streptococcus oricebi TaxID=1547447 RepID=A0ABS5B251_9STRE|nr:Rrf2 family transcriptional regulator [Streptococcus oricebi]MBP2622905.1 Rrf2 family transcriptional regulator [Streptococcus oricebi]